MQVEIMTSMAKMRDKQFVEDGISESDIDAAMTRLSLEMDPDYAKLMQAHQVAMNKL